MTILERIQSYLENGGYFNPEMMEHDKVRDLILDIRTFISKNVSTDLFSPCKPTAFVSRTPKNDTSGKPRLVKWWSMKNQLLHGYEVETCVELPPNDSGDPDYDRAKYRRFDLPTKQQALALAKKLAPDDKWGSVAVTEFIREPYEPGSPALRKEFVSVPEYIEALP